MRRRARSAARAVRAGVRRRRAPLVQRGVQDQPSQRRARAQEADAGRDGGCSRQRRTPLGPAHAGVGTARDHRAARAERRRDGDVGLDRRCDHRHRGDARRLRRPRDGVRVGAAHVFERARDLAADRADAARRVGARLAARAAGRDGRGARDLRRHAPRADRHRLLRRDPRSAGAARARRARRLRARPDRRHLARPAARAARTSASAAARSRRRRARDRGTRRRQAARG